MAAVPADAVASLKKGTRVLLADKMSPLVMAWLNGDVADRKSIPSASLFNARIDPSLKDLSLVEALKDFNPEVIVVRSTKVTKAHMDAAPALNLIIRAGSGYNTIDVLEASARGIYVANCPGKNACAVAELALGHLIACDRRIPDGTALFRQKKWDKKGLGKGNRGLRDRTLAIIGLGQIGKLLAHYCKAIGMHVRAFDIMLTKAKAEELGVEYAASITECVTGADAMSIHLPLNSATRGLISRDILDKLNDGAIVVNTSRGGVINEKDLLEVGIAKGLKVGVDVLCDEPAASDKELRATSFPLCESTVVRSMTHHIGASTAQAEDSVGREVLRIIASTVDTGDVPNCVNLEANTKAACTLVVRTADKPGVLSKVMMALLAEDINIENMSNIVFKGAKAACAKLELSKRPSPECVAKMMSNDDVFSTKIA